MRIFVTKHALTRGILEKEALKRSETMVRIVGTIPEYYHKPYWYENLEEAKTHAEELRKNKIESIHKQLKKLDKLVF